VGSRRELAARHALHVFPNRIFCDRGELRRSLDPSTPDWHGWRRVALNLAYAYGIESFEDLTADRLGSLGASTAAGGVRIALSSLTLLTATWEHQWRSNNTAIDRLTLSIMQSFP
jgi:hypothetical protein